MKRAADGVVASELHIILARVALRLAAASACRALARAAMIGAAGLWLVALATLVLPVTLPWGAAGAVLAAGLAVAFPVLLRCLRPPLLVAARIADRRLDLADRLGTAVDLLGRPEPLAGLARLQVTDALECARTVAPRTAAPLRIPRDAWIAAAGAASLMLWGQFLAGLTLPATPAGRMAVIIHGEGGRLADIGRRIDEVGRARGLPGARRIAPLFADLGRALEMPRVTRQGATGLLRQAAEQLGTAQATLDRQLAAVSVSPSDTRDARTPPTPETGAQRLERLQAAMRELEALSGQLRAGDPGQSRALAQRLRALSETLDRSGDMPEASRQKIAAAIRAAEEGQASVGVDALGDAVQDLERIERMLGDAQVLSEARREVQRSSERIAEGETSGGAQVPTAAQDQASPESSSSLAPGSAAIVPGPDTETPPPPGPNQGSLPGQGRGGTAGAPTPRLQGTRVPTHLTGNSGEGAAAVEEITAAGRTGTPHLPARRLPVDVAHEVDRAPGREPLPPAYLDIVRRYFEMLGGTP